MIRSSTLEGCGASSVGGAVAAVAEKGVASVAVLIDDTAFDGSWLYSGGSGGGAGFYFAYKGDALNTTTMVRGTNFTNGVLANGGGSGAGFYFQYIATATKVLQQIEQCVFRNNTVFGATYPGNFVTGGGMGVFMRGDSAEVTFTFLQCVFVQNVLRAGGEQGTGQGAGVYMQLSGHVVRSVVLLAERSVFEGNVISLSGEEAFAYGAGFQMDHHNNIAEHTTITFSHCAFTNNIARAEPKDGQAEGPLYLSWEGTSAGGVLVNILDSTFVGNLANGR
jgi:hypothetical protein